MDKDLMISSLKLSLQQSEILRKQQGLYVKRLRVVLRRTQEALSRNVHASNSERQELLEDIRKALSPGEAN